MERAKPVADTKRATLSPSLACIMATRSHSQKMLHFHKVYRNLSGGGERSIFCKLYQIKDKCVSCKNHSWRVFKIIECRTPAQERLPSNPVTPVSFRSPKSVCYSNWHGWTGRIGNHRSSSASLEGDATWALLNHRLHQNTQAPLILHSYIHAILNFIPICETKRLLTVCEGL